jgi:hypothetical protein
VAPSSRQPAEHVFGSIPRQLVQLPWSPLGSEPRAARQNEHGKLETVKSIIRKTGNVWNWHIREEAIGAGRVRSHRRSGRTRWPPDMT